MTVVMQNRKSYNDYQQLTGTIITNSWHRKMEESINAQCRQTCWYTVQKLNSIWVLPVQLRTLGARPQISLPSSYWCRGGCTKPKPALVKHSPLKEQLSCKAIVFITQPKLPNCLNHGWTGTQTQKAKQILGPEFPKSICVKSQNSLQEANK